MGYYFSQPSPTCYVITLILERLITQMPNYFLGNIGENISILIYNGLYTDIYIYIYICIVYINILYLRVYHTQFCIIFMCFGLNKSRSKMSFWANNVSSQCFAQLDTFHFLMQSVLSYFLTLLANNFPYGMACRMMTGIYQWCLSTERKSITSGHRSERRTQKHPQRYEKLFAFAEPPSRNIIWNKLCLKLFRSKTPSASKNTLCSIRHLRNNLAFSWILIIIGLSRKTENFKKTSKGIKPIREHRP